MRRAGPIAALCAGWAALAVPAGLAAAESGDAGDATASGSPSASFTVSPAPPIAGRRATLDASSSRSPDGSVLLYSWDLDGDGRFETLAGPRPTLRTTLRRAGRATVGLRVIAASGAFADSVRVLPVQPATTARRPDGREVDGAGDRARARGEGRREQGSRRARGAGERGAGRTGGSDRPRSFRPRNGARRAARTSDRRRPRARPAAPRARTAASKTVTIRDFKFSPGLVTVTVGDRVTWINRDRQGHTATADDGSFDTGILRTGQSGSRTFREEGTFSYHCTPHPGMKARVRVVAAGSGGGTNGSGGQGGGSGSGDSSSGGGGSGGGSGSAGGAGDSGTGGDAAGEDPELPSTGAQTGALALIGGLLLLIGSGLGRQAGLARGRRSGA